MYEDWINLSELRKILYGVPKGSVMGPILFSLYTFFSSTSHSQECDSVISKIKQVLDRCQNGKKVETQSSFSD